MDWFERPIRDPNVARVCAMTGLGPNQVRRLIREGRIPGAIIGTRVVITEGQFEQLNREGIRPAPKVEAPEPKTAGSEPAEPDPVSSDFLKKRRS